MKKMTIILKILVCMLLLFGPAIGTLKAQGPSKEPAQSPPAPVAAPAPQPEPAQPLHLNVFEGGEKGTHLPVDSSKVIPKGPQWLGAPLIPGGRKVLEEPGRYVQEYDKPYNEVLAWYQEALKNYPDARYRDWPKEMYIEDQGASKWLAIKISKTGGPKTEVTIVKDNWTWIWATLFIRFTGVFVVLLALWIGLHIATIILLRFIKEEKQEPAISAST